jgi:hypothetical protein
MSVVVNDLLDVGGHHRHAKQDFRRAQLSLSIVESRDDTPKKSGRPRRSWQY